MKSIALCPLVVLVGIGNVAFAQNSPAPYNPTATPAPQTTAPAAQVVVPSTVPAAGLPAGTMDPAAAAVAAAASDVAPKAAVVAVPNTLLDGTAIKLKLAENLTSATAKVGQQVSFIVVDEVDVQGVPVIAKGAQAVATVTEAQGKRSMGRGGKLDVNIDSVRLVDGDKVMLRATEGGKGGGHTGAMTAGMVGTAIVFFPAAPQLLFIHGKDITIPEGTIVTAFVAGDDKLDMAKFAPTDAPVTPTATAAAPAQATMASILIDSSVPGADIEVDGAFVGNTPSTVTVTPGKHTIGVKKKGYTDWTRDMNVMGDGAKVNADLEANR